MGKASQKFDRRLFTLKLSELSSQMHIRSVVPDGEASVRSQETRGSFLMYIVDRQLTLLRDGWLKGVDRIAREVWQTQGEVVTPDFVRNVLVPEAMTLIAVRDGVIKTSVERAHQTRLENPYPARHHLAREIRKLTGEVANRYEIEARELEYQKVPAAHSGPQSQLEELGSIHGLIEDATRDTMLWLQVSPSAEERVHVLAIQGLLATLARIIERRMERRGPPEDDRQWSETLTEVLLLLDKAKEVRGNIVGKGLARLQYHLPRELPGPEPRRLSQAPAPPTPVGGLGLSPYRTKPTQVPPNLPPYYPDDLNPRTHLIIAEAVRKFPEQAQILELCKYVMSELTPHFRAAIQRGMMRADLALSDNGIEGVLHYLLVHNCDHENKRYRLAQEARRSDEWLRLTKEIADAAEHKARADRLGGIQASEQGPKRTERATRTCDPDVAKRRALVRSNAYAIASEMSEIFDRENVPPPAKWQEAGLQTWSKAYKVPKYRSRIDVLVSKDKRNS